MDKLNKILTTVNIGLTTINITIMICIYRYIKSIAQSLNLFHKPCKQRQQPTRKKSF